MGRSRSSQALPESAEQRALLNQRRIVLAFYLFFVAVAGLSTLLPWYGIYLSETLVFNGLGTGQVLGKVFLTAVLVAFFFATFDLIHNEELDWPLFAAALIGLGLLADFLYQFSHLDAFIEGHMADANLRESLMKRVEDGRPELRVSFAPGLFFALVSALNMAVSGLYLTFFHPRVWVKT